MLSSLVPDFRLGRITTIGSPRLRQALKLSLAIIILVLVVVWSCSDTHTHWGSTAMVNGVNLVAERSALVAEQSNEAAIQNQDSLEQYQLYRTSGGQYFLQSEVGQVSTLELESDSDAAEIYKRMTRHKFTCADCTALRTD
jgi:hypothetical protein